MRLNRIFLTKINKQQKCNIYNYVDQINKY